MVTPATGPWRSAGAAMSDRSHLPRDPSSIKIYITPAAPKQRSSPLCSAPHMHPTRALRLTLNLGRRVQRHACGRMNGKEGEAGGQHGVSRPLRTRTAARVAVTDLHGGEWLSPTFTEESGKSDGRQLLGGRRRAA
eukprot:350695-Chlamydomonas_euryale.AAC.2